MADQITSPEPAVEPKEDTTAPVQPESVEPNETEAQPSPDAKTAALPDKLLQIPAMGALFAGEPPALSAHLKNFEKRPEAKLIMENREPLMKAGMGFYRSLSGDLGVVFNQLYIHPDQLKAADKVGKLLSVAPPFDTVNHAVSKMGPADHPVLNHAGVIPPTVKPAPPVVPPQFAGNPMPASAQKKLATARIANLRPPSPTSGPAPGQGQLLQSILKPVI